MALKSMVMEFGTGTDIRGGDVTKAALRAVHAALRQNSITFAQAFDVPREAMIVKIVIGVTRPEEVDRDAVAAILPYGTAQVSVVEGGMAIERETGPGATILANAALTVFLDFPQGDQP